MNDALAHPTAIASSNRFIVAQTFSLPYRRLSVGQAFERKGAGEASIAWQNGILRYGRLKVCATTPGRFLVALSDPGIVYAPLEQSAHLHQQLT